MPELAALRHLVDDPFAGTCWQPAGEDEEAIVADVAQIAVDCARYGGNRLGGELLAHELAVLMVRIARSPRRPRAARPPRCSASCAPNSSAMSCTGASRTMPICWAVRCAR